MARILFPRDGADLAHPHAGPDAPGQELRSAKLSFGNQSVKCAPREMPGETASVCEPADPEGRDWFVKSQNSSHVFQARFLKYEICFFVRFFVEIEKKQTSRRVGRTHSHGCPRRPGGYEVLAHGLRRLLLIPLHV